MPTISSKISKKEHDAIIQYANACGETVSNLIRKVLISESTFYNGFGGPKEFECRIITPENCSSEEENKIVKDAYNHSRKILGFEEIDEI
ncbi:MAG: hypothetical protein IIA83_00280 [Thaumarchaeota archaeon]|nr:hypothetical protein [Nitrososphaerota archaeon]